MKKLLTVIVPLAMVVAVGSVCLADDAKAELNKDLNKDISGEVQGGGAQAQSVKAGLADDSSFDDVELNSTNTREGNTLAAKRGLQARRGQTASELSDLQKYWGDHKSGKEKGKDDEDETPDEDEDGDGTPTTP